MVKKVALVIAYEGYQPQEYAIPKKCMLDAGIQVLTVSDTMGQATAKDNSTTTVDISLDALHIQDIDALFFIGGPGALDHLDHNTSYRLLQQAAQQNMPFGAICIAPRILAKAGVLTNKRATGWDDDNQLGALFTQYHVHYEKQPVVTDGLTITAVGPRAAEEFGKAIIALVHKTR